MSRSNKYNVVNTTPNSGYKKWRILLKPVVDFPLENLYFSRKYAVTKFATSCSRGTLYDIFGNCMKNISILILTSILFLISCKKENRNIKFTEIDLVDDSSNKLFADKVDSFTEAEFSPLYIGEISSEIKLSYRNDQTVKKTENWNKYKYPKINSIKMFIDTTKIIGIPISFDESPKSGKRNNKMAYPVFIKSTNKDTVNIGYDVFLPIITEAKDRDGNWRAIQKKFHFDCGTGIQDFYCAPNQIVISSMKKFRGNFKTKLRLKFESMGEKSYSNEIEGEINESQFNK